MRKIKYLQDLNITPVMVMDGKSLPSKIDTEKERRENRIKYRERADNYFKEGET